jgi:hypothetical protein
MIYELGVLSKEEKKYIEDRVRIAKKEIKRQRDLSNLTVKSAWNTVPVYCEIESIVGDKVLVENEYRESVWFDIEDFISKHTFYA